MSKFTNYACVIKSHGLTESSQKHTPCVQLRVVAYKCLDDGKFCNKQFVVNLWLSEKAREKSITTLQSIGFDGDTLESLNIGNELVDVECEVATSWEEWEGKQYERAQFVSPKGSYDSRGIKRMDNDNAMRLSKAVDGMLKNKRAVGKKNIAEKKELPAPAPDMPSVDEEDDFPF